MPEVNTFDSAPNPFDQPESNPFDTPTGVTPSPVMPKGHAAYGHHVLSAAQEYGLDPSLLSGLIHKETGGSWDPGAYNSKSGAIGMTQMLPATAKSLNIDPDKLKSDPSLQVRGGAKYLRQLINDIRRKYPGLPDTRYEDLALAWYNGGEGEMEKLRTGKPMVPETADYVPGVRRFASAYRQPTAPPAPPKTGGKMIAPGVPDPRTAIGPIGQPLKAPTLGLKPNIVDEAARVWTGSSLGAEQPVTVNPTNPPKEFVRLGEAGIVAWDEAGNVIDAKTGQPITRSRLDDYMTLLATGAAGPAPGARLGRVLRGAEAADVGRTPGLQIGGRARPVVPRPAPVEVPKPAPAVHTPPSEPKPGDPFQVVLNDPRVKEALEAEQARRVPREGEVPRHIETPKPHAGEAPRAPTAVRPQTASASTRALKAFEEDMSKQGPQKSLGHKEYTANQHDAFLNEVDQDIKGLADRSVDKDPRLLRRAMGLHVDRAGNPAEYDAGIETAMQKDPRIASAERRRQAMNVSEKEYADFLADHVRKQSAIMVKRGVLKETRDWYIKHLLEEGSHDPRPASILGGVTQQARKHDTIPSLINSGAKIREDTLDIGTTLTLTARGAERAVSTRELITSMVRNGMGKWERKATANHPINMAHHEATAEYGKAFERNTKFGHYEFHVNKDGETFLKDFVVKTSGKQLGGLGQKLKALKVLGGLFHPMQMLKTYKFMNGRLTNLWGVLPQKEILPTIEGVWKAITGRSMGELYKSMPLVQDGMNLIREGNQTLKKMEEAGLVVGRNPDEFYASMGQKLGMDRDVLTWLSDKMGHKFWQQMWGPIKAATAVRKFESIVKNLGPNATETQVSQAMKDVILSVNDHFGGQFYAGMKIPRMDVKIPYTGGGRVKANLLASSRTLAFATDWLWSQSRLMYSALATRGIRGNIARATVTKALLGQFASAQAIQYMINGKSTLHNEKGREFYIDVTDKLGKTPDGQRRYVPIAALAVTKLMFDLGMTGVKIGQHVVQNDVPGALADVRQLAETKLAPAPGIGWSAVKGGLRAIAGDVRGAGQQIGFAARDIGQAMMPIAANAMAAWNDLVGHTMSLFGIATYPEPSGGYEPKYNPKQEDWQDYLNRIVSNRTDVPGWQHPKPEPPKTVERNPFD